MEVNGHLDGPPPPPPHRREIPRYRNDEVNLDAEFKIKIPAPSRNKAPGVKCVVSQPLEHTCPDFRPGCSLPDGREHNWQL